ncbi:hypothetical protein CCZ37_07400 [Vibrio qinghaiensis]|jgi:hypothetical protein|uniref:Uncharacterized protein n=1 Tax=Vibrio qinghaiensis TaxID=2025808 RepID=A0A223MXY4_9VIBR|nr:hypothetical protein [Vibrio qinghaiensis]ASU22426.1 hypothetical protein CCZ37_07400 [Vibrio qinghaiensis]
MRSVSFSIFSKAERVSEVSSTKQTREESQPKRVRDVKQVAKRTKKHPRLFRIRRKLMTPQNQRQFARLLQGYQLKALKDWQGFTDTIVDLKSLNDAQLFILQAALYSEHLYPEYLRKKLKQYIDSLGVLEEGLEADSDKLQQLIAYEHYLEGLLSLLALCRKYDARERSGPKVMRKNGQDDEK